MLHAICFSHPNPLSMHLTLFVPDLLWPDIDDAAAFDFAGAPALARFLFLSQATRQEMQRTDAWESRLAAIFGFSATQPPLAALRCLGQGLPVNGECLCTDPVNLDFMQQALVLSPIPADTLSGNDTASLLASLNEEFADEGRFVAASVQQHVAQWTFVPAVTPCALPDLAACSHLAGRRVDADETRELLGRDGLRWLNRIQMCLNQHPVNAAREAQGLPLINSLWPWGLGVLRDSPPARFKQVFEQSPCQSSLLSGLCQATQTPLSTAAELPRTAGNTLVVDCRLTDAIADTDLAAWQSAISETITCWLTPALTALEDRQHPLQSITLISPNAHHEHRWVLDCARSKPGNFFQRCFGPTPKAPNLHDLVRSWAR